MNARINMPHQGQALGLSLDDLKDCAHDALRAIERAAELFRIAQDMAPKDSELHEFMDVAFLELCEGSVALGSIHGYEVEIQ